MFDWLVVGAGFAGSVIAERLASQRDEKVLVIDRRPHIGGNAYDVHDKAGVLIHQYGPHIFHTNSQAIFDHLSQFTDWRPYQHRAPGRTRYCVAGGSSARRPSHPADSRSTQVSRTAARAARRRVGVMGTSAGATAIYESNYL